MKVLNSSKITKNLKNNKFQPGVSEHPDTPQISSYVSSHPDLSIYKHEEKKTEFVVEEVVVAPIEEEEKEEKNHKGHKRKAKKESYKQEE